MINHKERGAGDPAAYIKSLDFSVIAMRCSCTQKNTGFGLASMVYVSLARHEQTHVEHFIREVMQHPEVLECFATSGEADFHLRVVVENIEAYYVFLDDFVFKLPGVSQVRSNIVLKEIKADTALPFK